MISVAVSLAALSALLHAIWNVRLKKAADQAVFGVAVAAVACCMGLLAGGAWFSSLAKSNVWLLTALAGVASGAALATISQAYRHPGEVGATFAVSRAGFLVLLWPASMLLLGEPADGTDFAGAALVCVSILMMTVHSTGMKFGKSTKWALLSAVCIVAHHLLYKAAISRGGHPLAVLGLSDIFRVAIACWLIGENRGVRLRSVWRNDSRAVIITGLVSFASFGLFLWALQFDGAARLGTVRNLSIMFTAILGQWMGDRLSARSWTAVILAFAGAVLLGLT